jgi:hypothetical protein
MHIYQEIYEFAASAGAFEGYVYRRPEAEIDFKALSNWVDNLLDAYRHLAPDVLSEFQSAEVIGKLEKMIAGELPDSADDFEKTKWFQK